MCDARGPHLSLQGTKPPLGPESMCPRVHCRPTMAVPTTRSTAHKPRTTWGLKGRTYPTRIQPHDQKSSSPGGPMPLSSSMITINYLSAAAHAAGGTARFSKPRPIHSSRAIMVFKLIMICF